ncbi:hypothetical protein IV71_GL000770 [Fructobacillus fructosus KCTC 3544]|nr:hypothetical protein IV71_GL000770 [Fructobacillus fructosus KCTC 3544]
MTGNTYPSLPEELPSSELEQLSSDELLSEELPEEAAAFALIKEGLAEIESPPNCL